MMERMELACGFNHVGIPVNDMDRTIAFYEKLDLHKVMDKICNGTRFVFMQNGTMLIEFFENHQADGVTGSVNHFCMNTPDVEAAYDLLKDQVIMVSNGIEFLPFWEHGTKYFIFEGPDKEHIELCQNL